MSHYLIQQYQNFCQKQYEKKHKSKQKSFVTQIKNIVRDGTFNDFLEEINNANQKDIEKILKKQYKKMNYDIDQSNLMSMAIDNGKHQIFEWLLNHSTQQIKQKEPTLFQSKLYIAWKSILNHDDVQAFKILEASHQIDVNQWEKTEYANNNKLSNKTNKNKDQHDNLFYFFIQQTSLKKKQAYLHNESNHPYQLFKYLLEQQNKSNIESNQICFEQYYKNNNQSDLFEQFKQLFINSNDDVLIDQNIIKSIKEQETQDISFYIDQCLLNLDYSKDYNNLAEAKNDIFHEMFIDSIKHSTLFHLNSFMLDENDCSNLNKEHVNVQNEQQKILFHFMMLGFPNKLEKNNFAVHSDYFFDTLGISKQELESMSFNDDHFPETIPISIIYDMIGLENEKQFLLLDDNLKQQHECFWNKWQQLYCIVNQVACQKFFYQGDFQRDNDLFGLFYQTQVVYKKNQNDEFVSNFVKNSSLNQLLNKMIVNNYSSIAKSRPYQQKDNTIAYFNVRDIIMQKQGNIKKYIGQRQNDYSLLQKTQQNIEKMELEQHFKNPALLKQKKLML